MKPHFYFDMDGVLVQYNKPDFIGEHPKYMIKDSHYFLNLKPDKKALTIMKTLDADENFDVSVLTSVVNGKNTTVEHIADKIAWIENYCPFINVETQVLIALGDKRDLVSHLRKRPLNKNDILIDDFNRNLLEWQTAGGSSVKYENGTNNPYSFNGTLILARDNVSVSINKLTINTQ